MKKSINLKLKDNSYKIIIGKNSLLDLADKINSLPITKCLLIVDKNVEKYHSQLIRKTFANTDLKTFKYVFNATEKNKSLKQAEKIYYYLSDNYFDRHSVIISIGGGITGDISGFVASTFMRGINYFNIPTTLLAMVDSSVGGKTGVNFSDRKNLIGTFHQPSGVYIDDHYLTTLPKKELISGTGEIFKYSLLADVSNYKLLKNSLKKIYKGNLDNYNTTIHNCLKIKSHIVLKDEKEITGLRKILNLGHTFAHAYEVLSNYKLKHGEAVIGGIFSALFASEKLGFISTLSLNKIINDFSFIKLNKLLYLINGDEVFQTALGDKKNLLGKIKLVLLEDIGKIVIDVPIDKSVIVDAVDKMKSLV
jgi:3-dehydroquinate synthase